MNADGLSTPPSTTRRRAARPACSSASSAATAHARTSAWTPWPAGLPGARGAVDAVRPRGRCSARLPRTSLIEQRWSARLPGGDAGAGTLLADGEAGSAASRRRPLRRHRDLDLLERLYGRCRVIGRTRRRRGAEHPSRRAGSSGSTAHNWPDHGLSLPAADAARILVVRVRRPPPGSGKPGPPECVVLVDASTSAYAASRNAALWAKRPEWKCAKVCGGIRAHAGHVGHLAAGVAVVQRVGAGSVRSRPCPHPEGSWS